MTVVGRRFPFWRFIGLAVAVVMLGVGVWQMVTPSGPSESPDSQSGVGLTSFPPAKQQKLPSISGRDLDGQPLELPRANDTVTVINVWGSWCAPCRAEAPDLARISKEMSAKGVRFYGIDTRDDLAAARAFVRRFRIPYPSFDDRDGQVLGAFTGIIPVSAVPSTLVVDARHRIVARVVGRVDATTLKGLIGDALTASAAPQSAGEPSAFRNHGSAVADTSATSTTAAAPPTGALTRGPASGALLSTVPPGPTST